MFRRLSKRTPLRVVFSTLFSVYGYPEETLSLVFDILPNVLAFDDLHCNYSTVFILPAAAQICSLPVEKGRCRASLRRFFFNSTSRQCEEFRFGGCEGNANRFDTEKECNDFCGCELCLELSLPGHRRISVSLNWVSML